MPRKPTPRIVKSNLVAPKGIATWERGFLLPLAADFVDELEQGLPPSKQPSKELDDKFVAACRRLGVVIERRRDEPDGSVLFTCRLRAE